MAHKNPHFIYVVYAYAVLCCAVLCLCCAQNNCYVINGTNTLCFARETTIFSLQSIDYIPFPLKIVWNSLSVTLNEVHLNRHSSKKSNKKNTTEAADKKRQSVSPSNAFIAFSTRYSRVYPLWLIIIQCSRVAINLNICCYLVNTK